jgi:hypothetical protein
MRLEAKRKIVGQHRVEAREDISARYMSGESIRSLANESGRSYGFIHRLLVEAGMKLRRRGAPKRKV